MSIWHPDVCSEGSPCVIVCEDAGSALISFEKKCEMHAAMGLSDDELDHLIRTDAMRWAVCASVMAEEFPDVVAGLSINKDRGLSLEIISAQHGGSAKGIEARIQARMAAYDPLVKHMKGQPLPNLVVA